MSHDVPTDHPTRTPIGDLHGRLLRDTFDRRRLSDRDAFLLFALFHHYQIELSGDVLSDRPNAPASERVPGHTWRGCAAALASLWEGADDERAEYTYWYYRWSTDWGGYGHSENLSADERARLRELMAMLERHLFVTRFVPEDGESDDLLRDS